MTQLHNQPTQAQIDAEVFPIERRYLDEPADAWELLTENQVHDKLSIYFRNTWNLIDDMRNGETVTTPTAEYRKAKQ